MGPPLYQGTKEEQAEAARRSNQMNPATPQTCYMALVLAPGQIKIAFATVTKAIDRPLDYESLLAAAYDKFNLDRTCDLVPVLTEEHQDGSIGDMTPLNAFTYDALDDGDLVVFHLQMRLDPDLDEVTYEEDETGERGDGG